MYHESMSLRKVEKKFPFGMYLCKGQILKAFEMVRVDRIYGPTARPRYTVHRMDPIIRTASSVPLSV